MKIAIDCGHTLRGSDTGAQGCGFREEVLTREIGSRLQAKLNALGHETLRCECDDCGSLTESLAYRTNKANNWGADLYVALHLNATPGGYGTEVYTYHGNEVPQARNVLNAICGDFGYRNRGIKGDGLYVTNHTNMTAFLVECCFIDSQDDMNKFDAEKMANAIARGITGQSSDATAPSQPSQPAPAPTPSTTYNTEPRYWVGRIQQVCCWNGFEVKVDNWYGDKTDAAVRQLPLSGKDYTNRDATRFIQERLGINVDGVFWDATDAAVRNWQASHGLTVDGVVGYNTYKSLALQD